MKTRTVVIIAVAIILNACGARHTSLLKKNEIKRYQTIAVTTFMAPSHSRESGGTAADLVAAELIRKGFNVIERAQLRAIINEQNLGYSGVLKPETITELGEIYGVKGIITGTVGNFQTDYYTSILASTPYSSASVTIKLIDVETGSLLWIGNKSLRKMNKSYHKLVYKNVRKIMKHFPKVSEIK